MSNLWLNVRFGNYHLQAEKLKFTWTFNDRHVLNPKRFEVYTLKPFIY